jgi:hypothetical protein
MTAVAERLARAGDALFERLERRFTLRTALLALFVLNLEVGLLATYVLVGPQRITDWVPILVPFVWINVALAAVGWTTTPTASERQKLLASGLAIGYFAVLAYVSGMVAPGAPEAGTTGRLALSTLPPGWAPAILLNTPTVRLSVIFYQFVGYLALAYLVYVTVLDASGSAVHGIVGLFSCVSCTWPVLGSILASVLGSGTAVTTIALDRSYALSTIIFVVTVLLLYWRPGIGALRRGSTG